MNPDVAYEDEMNEVALFETALRAAVLTQPDRQLGADLVPRLAQIARSAPFGSLAGLATHPSRFGACPRTKTTSEPSAEICRFVRSIPSSRSWRVRRTGVNDGAAAV